MIELPEAVTLSRQLSEALTGRAVTHAEANHSPHRLAWYTGDPTTYDRRLSGRRVVGASSHGGLVELATDGPTLVLGDGASPRLLPVDAPPPARHQLLLAFDDGSRLVVTIAMYGGIQLPDREDALDRYRARARAVPSPLDDGFDAAHWSGLLEGNEKLRLKALLATEQRIPGLGNGVLQDILWTAGLHPRRAVGSLDAHERVGLLDAVRSVIGAMTRLGGRSTERDLYGSSGGYPVVMQKAALDRPCPRCGGAVTREQFLGGAVYVCGGCQR
jgi:formamidopyrimidine-DNA glycosylase